MTHCHSTFSQVVAFCPSHTFQSPGKNVLNSPAPNESESLEIGAGHYFGLFFNSIDDSNVWTGLRPIAQKCPSQSSPCSCFQVTLKQGFSTLSLLIFWPNRSVLGGCLCIVACVLSSTPWPLPPICHLAPHSPVVTIKNVSRRCQCPRGG